MHLVLCIENVWWKVVYGAMQCHFFGILGNEYSTENLWYVHQAALFFR
jgi:hypothetical protein